MSGIETEGYTKIVNKKYNKAYHEFEDERLPNANVRFSKKVTGVIPYGQEGIPTQTITTITIPTGKQLRLLYLNFWSKDPDNPAQLVITQAGGTSHGLPDGQVDALMVPPMGSPGQNPLVLQGTLEKPIHILEGTVTFKLQNQKADKEYGLSIWGDSNSPQVI